MNEGKSYGEANNEMNEHDYDYTKYKAFVDERRQLVNAANQSFQFFDKGILTLAAGALGVSITFINDIVSDIKPETKYLLLVAWIGFIISILSTLISFLSSGSGHLKHIEELQKWYFSENQKTFTRRFDWPKWLNYTSIGTFILGASLLAAFCYTNL